MCACTSYDVQRSKDNSWKLVLSSYIYIGPDDQTHIIRLARKCLYPLSILPGHKFSFLLLSSFSSFFSSFFLLPFFFPFPPPSSSSDRNTWKALACCSAHSKKLSPTLFIE